jgi:hypothetical protein
MTVPSQIPPAVPPLARSNFVTVLAWVSIVLAGLVTVITLKPIIYASMKGIYLWTALARPLPDAALVFLPPVAGFIPGRFSHVLVSSGLTLAAAIGLLKRRNWARLLFISLLVLGIIWSIAKVVPQFVILAFWLHPFDYGSPATPVGVDSIMVMMMGFSAVMAIGFAILFGWIIKRLISPDFRREFVAL